MIAAIVRSFNNKNLPQMVEPLLKHLDYVVVAINVDIENRGEEENGAYTKHLIENAFGQNDKIIVHPVINWGKNPGSAVALNEAPTELFYRLQRLPTANDIIFNVSVESKIKPAHIQRATELFKQKENLVVVGISRKIYIGEEEKDKRLAEKLQNQLESEGRLQYRIPQNTASFWRADLLGLVGGFRIECNFTGLTVSIEDREVPVAGMEDFPTLCRLVMSGYNWTMIKDDPIIWDLSDVKKDRSRWQVNLNKMMRQECVMEIWSKKFFGISLGQMIVILDSSEI